jgi:hypothetical protein
MIDTKIMSALRKENKSEMPRRLGPKFTTQNWDKVPIFEPRFRISVSELI